jgi:hypothetical protein
MMMILLSERKNANRLTNLTDGDFFGETSFRVILFGGLLILNFHAIFVPV